MKLPYIHHKRAKGRDYWYFDTGAKVDGKPILTRLPSPKDPEFGRAYQAARSSRTKRGSVENARTFDWLCLTYEKSPEFRKLAESSRRLYARCLGYANSQFRSGDGKSWPLSIVTSRHVLELRDKRADKPGMANATVRAIMAMYAWAKKPGRQYVSANIAHEIEQLEGGEYEPWPKELVQEALNDPEIRLPVALLYYLGQRIGDTIKLGSGNMADGIISLTQQKTGKSLRIAVHSRLKQILATDAPKDAILFLVNENGKPLTQSALRQRLQKWAKDRGVHVVPHGLRKNAVNALLEAECSAAQVSSITGQSIQLVEHYAKLRDGEVLSRAAILKFERKNKAG